MPQVEPSIGYNEAVEHFRDTEYPMLKDSIYLDHAGSTLCAKSVMEAFAADMTSNLYGNPHSASASSQRSMSRIEDTRLRLLDFFNADPAEYDLVFVQNATAGIKLVVEGMRSLPGGFRFAHHQACHTSIIGAREDANASVCLDAEAVEAWKAGQTPFLPSTNGSSTLFAYAAQSHMDGQRCPLSWSRALKETQDSVASPVFTLLDAASFCTTSPLDLSREELDPDFVVLSLYKLFGFPDLGVLLVKHSAAAVFNHRRYFGGGTVDVVVCGTEQWHASKYTFLHDRLEDGTLPFHNIMAVDHALDAHQRISGSMQKVSAHVGYLAQRLSLGLRNLQHWNQRPVCVMYGAESGSQASLGVSAIISFNIKNAQGAWLSPSEVEKLAVTQNIHIRTGGLCSPGGIASALGLEPWELRRNFSSGFRCGTEQDISGGKPTGMVRVSLGAMSTRSDIDAFLNFVQSHFVNEIAPAPTCRAASDGSAPPEFRVKSITVYPIKSCAGMAIPSGVPWEVRPEGLAWDREWCLVHQGSGHALSQKRYPKMALLRPHFDAANGCLRVTFAGSSDAAQRQVEIPLSQNLALFKTVTSLSAPKSRVCGEEFSAQTYVSREINSFFSDVLGVPCLLTRFPPGGTGTRGRASKAQLQNHQIMGARALKVPGSFPGVPSPPDSDSEQQQRPRQDRILLANESPILLVNSTSVDALNAHIISSGSPAVEESSFRANVIIEPCPGYSKTATPYGEDLWRSIRIGSQRFRLLGSCRRCQMVCVDQATGDTKREPLSTLAKTRRFDGKVYFGVHMTQGGPDMQSPSWESASTVSIGELVAVDDNE